MRRLFMTVEKAVSIEGCSGKAHCRVLKVEE
jgi:hypothetical protein